MPVHGKNPLPLQLCISPALYFLRRKQWRGQGCLRYPADRRASIKDIIEAIGIPHTEVGILMSNGRKIDFSHLPKAGERIEVGEIDVPFLVDKPSLLRPLTVPRNRFLVDINVGKLASLLRMAGMDTALNPHATDEQLALHAAREKRILLTRDRQLLCRSAVHFGRLLRTQDPYAQLREVIDFFGLEKICQPFSRCIKCNTPLERVDKAAILHLLEPRTRLYYRHFRQCPGCSAIFWQGSHRQSMERHLKKMGLEWLARAQGND